MKMHLKHAFSNKSYRDDNEEIKIKIHMLNTDSKQVNNFIQSILFTSFQRQLYKRHSFDPNPIYNGTAELGWSLGGPCNSGGEKTDACKTNYS